MNASNRNFYAIGQEYFKSYASAYHQISDLELESCSTCQRVLERCRRLPTRKLIWFETTRGPKQKRGKLADFTWHGRSDEVLISDRLKHVLEPFLVGHPVQEIAYENNFELPSANAGRPIWQLTDLPFAHIDLADTGAELKETCPECGDKTFNFNAEMDLVISRESWDDRHFFSVAEFPMMFVTETVLTFLKEFGATNFQVRRSATLG